MRPLKTYEVHLLFVTGLYVLGLAVYSNSLSGPFVLDDYPNIRENPSIRMTGIDVDALYRAGFESVDTQPPLAYISFALNYYFGDYDVFAYHLVNVLLHIANGVLLYFLVLLIGRAEGSNQTPWAWVAFVAGVIFLVHPIQTQAVTYIVQRITSLAAFFYLLALLLYGLGRLNPALGKRVVLWCFAGFSGLCALATKETALSLPLAILLWEWYLSKEAGLAVLTRCWPLLLLSGAVLASALSLGNTPGESFSTFNELGELTLAQRVLTETRVMMVYLGLIVWPTPARLNLLHEMSLSYGWLVPPTTLIAAVFLAGLGGVSVWLKRISPIISLGLVWFLVHLVFTVSSPAAQLVAEHRMYLPMVGISVAVGYMFISLSGRYRASGAVLAIGIVVCLGSATFLRNAVWQDRLTLWVDVVIKSPQSARALNNLGRALVDKGRYDEAVTQFTEALFHQPDYAEAHNNLGVLMASEGRYSESLHYFRSALAARPK